jgi:hypothetical protein
VSPADSDKGWADFYKLTTQSELSEITFLHDSAPQPPLYLKEEKSLGEELSGFKDFEDAKSWYRDKVPPHVALRIAAVRETFEECGILIVRENVVEEASKRVGREGRLGMANIAGIKNNKRIFHKLVIICDILSRNICYRGPRRGGKVAD